MTNLVLQVIEEAKLLPTKMCQPAYSSPSSGSALSNA